MRSPRPRSRAPSGSSTTPGPGAQDTPSDGARPVATVHARTDHPNHDATRALRFDRAGARLPAAPHRAESCGPGLRFPGHPTRRGGSPERGPQERRIVAHSGVVLRPATRTVAPGIGQGWARRRQSIGMATTARGSASGDRREPLSVLEAVDGDPADGFALPGRLSTEELTDVGHRRRPPRRHQLALRDLILNSDRKVRTGARAATWSRFRRFPSREGTSPRSKSWFICGSGLGVCGGSTTCRVGRPGR